MVEHSDAAIRSIELQLVRVETCGKASRLQCLSLACHPRAGLERVEGWVVRTRASPQKSLLLETGALKLSCVHSGAR